MYFIKKLLKKEGVQFLGRGGILYFDGIYEYYVDTENFIPNILSKDNYGVIIYPEVIRYKNYTDAINNERKSEIALAVQKLLKKKEIIAEIKWRNPSPGFVSPRTH